MEAAVRSAVLRRIAYTEGHLAGIRRMIEGDKLCIEIMRQTHAVRRAIQRMEALLLRAHLETCVVPTVRDGRGGQGIRQFVQLYAMASKRRERDGNGTRTP